MLRHARPRGHVGRIVASVNPLIPKPGTAYQWLPMEDPALTDRKGKRLRALVADLDNVYFNIKSERHSYYQALLSLGDRRVAPAIELAERNGGNWRAAVAEAGLDASFYIFRDRSSDRVLPWDIIDGGMKRLFSARSSTRACARNGRCPRSVSRRIENSCRCCRSAAARSPHHAIRRSPARSAPRTLPESGPESGFARCCRSRAAGARSCGVRH